MRTDFDAALTYRPYRMMNMSEERLTQRGKARQMRGRSRIMSQSCAAEAHAVDCVVSEHEDDSS